jgi:hypothetical protein
MSDMTDHTISSSDGKPYTLPVFQREEVKQAGIGWECVGKTTFRASNFLSFVLYWATCFFVAGTLAAITVMVGVWVWISRLS